MVVFVGRHQCPPHFAGIWRLRDGLSAAACYWQVFVKQIIAVHSAAGK